MPTSLFWLAEEVGAVQAEPAAAAVLGDIEHLLELLEEIHPPNLY
jgi:hypothetical protein